MPKYIVRICKSEHVLLSADVEIVARSTKSAKEKVRRLLAKGEEFEELWFESDVEDTNKPIEILAAWVDRSR
jgi:hypothetical protein